MVWLYLSGCEFGFMWLCCLLDSTLVCLSFARDVGLIMFGGLYRFDAPFPMFIGEELSDFRLLLWPFATCACIICLGIARFW